MGKKKVRKELAAFIHHHECVMDCKTGPTRSQKRLAEALLDDFFKDFVKIEGAATIQPSVVRLEHSDTVLLVHREGDCLGENCTVHNRSDHPLRKWVQHWDARQACMMRLCEHGQSHIDPDETDYTFDRMFRARLRCDRCCLEAGAPCWSAAE